MKKLSTLPALLGLTALLALGGCSTAYLTPGPKADLTAVTPASRQDGFSAKPAATFPVSVVAVRVQAPDYSNWNLQQQGGGAKGGRYSVVTTRESGEDTQLDRLARLPQVAGMITLNRMLLPQQMNSDQELRQAASRLQADLMLVYTFDTSFFDTDASRPITLLTLGFAPTRTVYVTTTASALLIDTRSGFIYSAYEATRKSELSASAWGTREAIDTARRNNERDAFVKLVDDVDGSWARLLERHGKKG